MRIMPIGVHAIVGLRAHVLDKDGAAHNVDTDGAIVAIQAMAATPPREALAGVLVRKARRALGGA